LRKAIGDAEEFRSPTKLTELLRNRWDRLVKGKGMTLGDYMDGYQDHTERAAS
jgi:hypothetical protein